MKESFIFYESFLNTLDELDPETELTIYRAITHYALRGEETELTGTAKAIFHLIQPQIDANNKRYEDGKKGGRPKIKTSGFEKQKPVVLENGENKKPNVNVNVNENVNENVNAPTKEEIETYCKLVAKKIDIDEFINWYSASGWKDKEGLPINWQQKVLSWAKKDIPKEEPKSPYKYAR